MERVDSATWEEFTQAAITRIERDAIIQNYSATRIPVLRKGASHWEGNRDEGMTIADLLSMSPPSEAFILVSEHHRFPIDLFEVTDGADVYIVPNQPVLTALMGLNPGCIKEVELRRALDCDFAKSSPLLPTAESGMSMNCSNHWASCIMVRVRGESRLTHIAPLSGRGKCPALEMGGVGSVDIIASNPASGMSTSELIEHIHVSDWVLEWIQSNMSASLTRIRSAIEQAQINSPWWFTGSIPGLADPSGSKEIAFISEYCPELLDFSASTDLILPSDDDPADIIGTMCDIYQSPSGLEHSAEVLLGCIETFLR